MIHKDEFRIYLVAGEPSGDILGARLMSALKHLAPHVRFSGVGGNAMESEGLESLFPIHDLSVMGVMEVLPRLPKIIYRLNETTRDAKQKKPAALVTIDSPDFCFRLAHRLKNQEFPLFHYVAPSVWAWRQGRAKKISQYYDHIFCLLPFEPPYFINEGLNASFVGHPITEDFTKFGNGKSFRKRHQIQSDETVLCVLPGSRNGEITRLMPVFSKTFDILKSKGRQFRIVLPTLRSVASIVRKNAKNWPGAPIIIEDGTEKLDGFSASNVALAASGTVSLELAMAGVPSVTTYKVADLTAWLVRKKLQVKHVSLVNLVLSGEYVPELLQENCRPEALALEIIQLLDNPIIANKQLVAFKKVIKILKGSGKGTPTTRTARLILNAVRKNT